MLPSGNLIAMGNFALSKFTTGAPSIKKCAVAPESEMACSTLRHILLVLQLVVLLFAPSHSSLGPLFDHAPLLVVVGGVFLSLLLIFRCLLLFSFCSHLAAHLFILPFTEGGIKPGYVVVTM